MCHPLVAQAQAGVSLKQELTQCWPFACTALQNFRQAETVITLMKGASLGTGVQVGTDRKVLLGPQH